MIKACDYHLHSTYSNDAVSKMEEIVKSAIKKGLFEITFTDHIELYENSLEKLRSSLFSEYDEFLLLKEKYKNKIFLKFGMELAQVLYDAYETNEVVDMLPFDFIIISLHCVRNETDYYWLDFSKIDVYEETFKYLKELKEIVDTFSNYSVIGHCDYLSRYIKKYNLSYSLNSIKYEFEPIFKKIIKDGRGIELNTSGLRTSHGETMPSKEILSVYKECGGEIITIGSDAHNSSDIGANFHKAVTILKKIGFEKITVFDKLEPQFIKI